MPDLHNIWDVLKSYTLALYNEWEKDNVNQLAAALAYYATFSLVPTVILIIAAGSMLTSEEAVRERVLTEVYLWVGEAAADIVRTALASQGATSGFIPSLVSTGAMLFGATQLFSELQEAMNRVWEVKQGGRSLRAMVKRRMSSLLIVAVLGVLLFASFSASTVISIANRLMGGFGYWEWVNTGATFALGTVLFGMLFKTFPAVKLRFRDVRLGAALTTLFLMIAKYLLALYVGRASIASTYGAVGTLVVFLLWVYVSAQIVLMGAQFTQVHARMRGVEVELEESAVRRQI